MSKKVIKIVAGTDADSAQVYFWEKFLDLYDIELLVLDHTALDGATALPVRIFPVVDDMPGYFRDLDKYLLGADLVVGVEASRLASFQALRCARKMGVPFVCLSHETKPFIYEAYKNIRAIQYDIFTHGDLFLTSSNYASQLLFSEGVAEAKVQEISPAIHFLKYDFSEKLRHRFRNYVGISADDLVIASLVDFDNLEQIKILCEGFRLSLNRQKPQERTKIRLFLCGQGQKIHEAKYLISDLGLGRNTFILSQDLTPFERDFYAAMDGMVVLRPQNERVPEELPWYILRALSSGVRLMSLPGSIAHDWTKSLEQVRADDFTSMSVSLGMSELIGQCLNLQVDRKSYAKLLRERMDEGRKLEAVRLRLGQILEVDHQVHRKEDISKFVLSHLNPVSFKEASDVLVKVEELREFSLGCDLEIQSELLRIKADALVALGRNEEAITSFDESLKMNSSNHSTLRGLGYLAWHGHSHEDALGFFKRALAIEPNDYHSLVGFGLVYRRVHMFDQAYYWLEKALEIGGLESSSLGLIVQACLEHTEAEYSLGLLKSIKESMGEHPVLVNAILKLESHQ